VPTLDIRIDKALLKQRQNKYPAVLAKLRSAIPIDYYPTVEASQQDIYYGHPFYPGRVLLGTNDGARVWAYLRKVRKDHNTTMELHYDDNRSGEEGHTPFVQSEFVPWCHLVADNKCPVGAPAWEDRLKFVVKIVMLEAGYSEATVSLMPLDLLTAIRRNVEKGLDNPPQVAELGIESPARRIAAPVASPSALDRIEEAEDGVEPPGLSKPTPRTTTAPHYVKVLRDAIPSEHWFQTRPIAAYEERAITLSDPNNREYFALFPGKVLLGHLRDDDKTPVWGAFRRPKPALKVQTLSGASRMCFFDDNMFEVELPETLDGTVEFAPAFQLLTQSKDTVGTSKVWFARISTCARVALIDAGLQDDEGFVTRHDARPKDLATVIKKAWARLRRTLQEDGKGREQEGSLPPRTRKSRKGHVVDASAIDATTPAQAQAPAGDQSSNPKQQAETRPEDSMIIEISEDEDDIMETGHQFRASSPWPTFPKREPFTPAPTSFALNKKAKMSASNYTSLLDFIDDTTATNTTVTAALEEQVRALTETKESLQHDKKQKQVRVTMLEKAITALQAENDAYKAKTQELETFKAKHVEHCQEVMLKLLTQRNMRNGSSEVDAKRDARMEYTQVYGLEVVEADETL
jgi:tryptophanyl-tRNA synthetase